MKLRSLLLLSHLVVAVIAGGIGVVGIGINGPIANQVISAVLLVVLPFSVAWFVSAKLKRGLQIMIQVAAKDNGEPHALGVIEFDRTAARLAEHIRRWSEAATSARQQSRDVEALLAQLDRQSSSRDMRGRSAGAHLRGLLQSISENVDSELHQVLNCVQELSSCVDTIGDGAGGQITSVTKTTTIVSQISAQLDAVTSNAQNTKNALSTVNDVARDSTNSVEALSSGVDRVQRHLEDNERKFRGLAERSREIGAMVDTINGIASRTDMLALNASIESVRAGEHGRGFAVVAEEVHRLAEQAAHATRDVAAMIDSIQLETEESIRCVEAERSAVSKDQERLESVQTVLERILRITGESVGQLGEIGVSSDMQISLTRDIARAVDQIADIATSTRTQAEKAKWTTSTLAKMTGEFDAALMPLRGHSERLPRRSLGPAQINADSFGGSGGEESYQVNEDQAEVAVS